MSHKDHGNPVATYIITALILGVITYIEFAIVEYEIAWLSRGAILFWLIALSVAKFVMVVAIFMHLKDDEKTYTGFFTSGMLIALATFFVLPILFTVASIPQGAAAAQAEEDVRTAEMDAPPPADRSQQVEAPAAAEPDATLNDEETAAQAQPEDPDAAAGGEGAGAGGFDREAGEAVYAANCQACHQANGAGMPGVFPPLAGSLIAIDAVEGGREYLIDVLLNGMSGQIEVAGQTYNGVMPPWPQLSDDQIAAVLNHEITAWDEEGEDFSPITAEEVGARRGQDPGNLAERRAELPIQ